MRGIRARWMVMVALALGATTAQAEPVRLSDHQMAEITAGSAREIVRAVVGSLAGPPGRSGLDSTGTGNIGAFNTDNNNRGAFNSGDGNIGAFSGNLNAGADNGNGNIGAFKRQPERRQRERRHPEHQPRRPRADPVAEGRDDLSSSLAVPGLSPPRSGRAPHHGSRRRATLASRSQDCRDAIDRSIPSGEAFGARRRTTGLSRAVAAGGRAIRRLVVIAAILLQGLAGGPASAADPARLAVFELELIDSSLQGEARSPDGADLARLRMIEAELRERLAASGRFELVDMAGAAAQREGGRRLWNCKGCEVAIARDLGADLALVGWVQKISNLILNINVAVRAVPTRELVAGGSVDIRGNTDESWRRGIRYLLERRLLED